MSRQNPLSILWTGVCTIYEYRDTVDPETFQTSNAPVAVVTDEPCRISYSRENVTDSSTGIPTISQLTKLFVRPDLVISPGSVIVVTQNGRTVKYKGSSEPAVYTRHQEIIVELYEDTA